MNAFFMKPKKERNKIG